MYLNCILSMCVCVCGGKEWCVVVWLMLKRVVMIASMCVCVCVCVCCGEERSGGRERERDGKLIYDGGCCLPSSSHACRVARGSGKK